jgi:DNA-directed RNA polymerase subunit omega
MTPTHNDFSMVPGDPEQSVFRFVIIASKRARQLQGGARPHLSKSGQKATAMAMEETRRGLISYEQYDDPNPDDQ